MQLYQKNKVSKKNHLSEVTNLQLIITESEKVAQSCLTFCDPMDYTVHGILQNAGVGSLSVLQEIFPTT